MDLVTLSIRPNLQSHCCENQKSHILHWTSAHKPTQKYSIPDGHPCSYHLFQITSSRCSRTKHNFPHIHCSVKIFL